MYPVNCMYLYVNIVVEIQLLVLLIACSSVLNLIFPIASAPFIYDIWVPTPSLTAMPHLLLSSRPLCSISTSQLGNHLVQLLLRPMEPWTLIFVLTIPSESRSKPVSSLVLWPCDVRRLDGHPHHLSSRSIQNQNVHRIQEFHGLFQGNMTGCQAYCNLFKILAGTLRCVESCIK
jgi:hypothetical protein